MNIFDYFTPKAETYYLDADSTIRQALEKFDYHKFNVVPLVDGEGRFVTTVSEGDILRYIKNDAGFDISEAEKERIRNIEKYRPYRACQVDVPFDTVLKLALEQNFVPITDDDGHYIGIVLRKALLNYLYSGYNSGKDAANG